MNRLYKTIFDTVLGTMIAIASEEGICLLDYLDNKTLTLKINQIVTAYSTNNYEGSHEYLEQMKEQLHMYFQGTRKIFELRLDLVGTNFQKQVWRSLMEIPYSTTISYAQQARQLGYPSAQRAIANANGRNKIAIILPCHRVIGKNGNLVGYGGGIWRKAKLIELETTNKML